MSETPQTLKSKLPMQKLLHSQQKKNELNSNIATLQSDIAELKKGLLERVELRGEDKADNAQTIQMTEEGINSVKTALRLLKSFYGSFIQYTPRGADRSGST